MKFATKELVENVVSEVANNSCFSVISKDRSFALTDDIIAQAMQPGDIVDRIEEVANLLKNCIVTDFSYNSDYTRWCNT